jgi:hypothetical protein
MKEALVAYSRVAFTLDVKDYSVESPNTTMLAIQDLKPSYP